MQRKITNNSQQKCDKNLLYRSKFVFALLFFCGFNIRVLKFFNKYRVLAVFYSLSLITITSLCTYYCSDVVNTIQVCSLVEYIFCVVILTVYNSKISQFAFKLTTIDTFLRLNVRHYYKNKKIFFFILITLWIVRLVYTTIHCSFYPCFTDLSLFIVSLFSSFSLDLYRVTRFSILDMVRHRLHLLHKRLEELPGYEEYFYVNENKISKEKKIRFCTKLYKSIADIFSLINPELHASMFVSIFCSIPKLIINVYHILLVLEGHEPLVSIGFLIMHMTQVGFLLFSPCIVVELLSVEVEKIKLHLIHRLLEEADPRTKEDIQEFLQYIEIRNFKCKIWRVIPMNVTLAVEVTNICTSSIIVAINITHLFG